MRPCRAARAECLDDRIPEIGAARDHERQDRVPVVALVIWKAGVSLTGIVGTADR